MARPYLFVGISALAASFFTLFGGRVTAVSLLVFSAVVITVIFGVKQPNYKKTIILAVAFLVLILRFITLIGFVESTNEKLIGKTIKISGSITGILSQSENFCRYTLKVYTASDSAAEGITVTADMFSSSQALPGDRISAEVVFVKCEDEFRAYNLSNGRYFFCEIEKMQMEKRGALTLSRIAYNLRTAIIGAVSSSTSGETGAVLKALIIGDASDISADLSADVKASGVSHMLVVSGMHLGIVCGILTNLLRRRSKRWVTAIVGIVFAAFITLVCLFHVSVVRASLAYFIMLIGRAVYRRPDGLSSLGFGTLVSVFFTPYIFYNVAYLLSLTATFAVIYPANMIMKTVNIPRKGFVYTQLRAAVEIIVISVSAIICTLPVTVHYFGYVALAAPVTNLLTNLCVTCALVAGVAAVFIFFIPIVGKLCSAPLFLAAELLAAYFIKVVDTIGERGWGVVRIPQDKNIYCFFTAIAFILLVRVFYMYDLKRKERAYLAQRENS